MDWRAPTLPVGFDLRGRRVLVEGVLRFEVFAPGRAEVFGNSDQVVPPVAWSDLAKAFAAGTSTRCGRGRACAGGPSWRSRPTAQRALTAATTLVSESLASPNSSVVFGS